MGSAFFTLHYHVVFSTKQRRPIIRPSWRQNLHRYMGGTIRGLGGVPEKIGGVEDHVHLLMSLRTVQAPAELIREIKKASSLWAAQNGDPYFAWQEGYSIFTASYTSLTQWLSAATSPSRKNTIEKFPFSTS